LDGVSVVDRGDGNYHEVVAHIAEQVERLSLLSPAELKLVRQEAHKVSVKADWCHFIRYYVTAYDEALRSAARRR
jgi:hypothetical protein